MTVLIKGRTRYADGPTTKVTIRRHQHTDPILVIEGGLFEFREHDRSFVLSAKHPTATDGEHSASYVAYLEGCGFQFAMMNPDGFDCYAAIFKAEYYDGEPLVEDWGGKTPDDCGYNCEEPHGYLSFTPPEQKWAPANFHITVEYQIVAPDEARDEDQDYK